MPFLNVWLLQVSFVINIFLWKIISYSCYILLLTFVYHLSFFCNGLLECKKKFVFENLILPLLELILYTLVFLQLHDNHQISLIFPRRHTDLVLICSKSFLMFLDDLSDCFSVISMKFLVVLHTNKLQAKHNRNRSLLIFCVIKRKFIFALISIILSFNILFHFILGNRSITYAKKTAFHPAVSPEWGIRQNRRNVKNLLHAVTFCLGGAEQFKGPCKMFAWTSSHGWYFSYKNTTPVPCHNAVMYSMEECDQTYFGTLIHPYCLFQFQFQFYNN